MGLIAGFSGIFNFGIPIAFDLVIRPSLPSATMIKTKILFAADLSVQSQEAFEVACRFAELWKAQLLIAHIDGAPDSSDRIDATRKLNHVVPDDVGIEFDYILRQGDPAEEILKLEREHNASMVVLGTHGRKGLKRWFSGSVAEQVIREADCPVLTMRVENLEQRPSQLRQPKVLVPVDFSVHSYAALDFASVIDQSLDGELTILYVDEEATPSEMRAPDANPELIQKQKELHERLVSFKPRSTHVRYTHEQMEGSAATQIVNYANIKHYDFIVLGTHGRTGLGRVLLGSVAEHVIRNAHCPVVTVKPSDKPNPILHFQALTGGQPLS